jgi:hypothetical protein
MAIREKDFKEEIRNILFEGFLEKESRILKTWRKYVPLTQTMVRPHCPPPLHLQRRTTILLAHRGHRPPLGRRHQEERRTHPPGVLLRTGRPTQRIETAQDCFFVVATSNSEREKWLGSIGTWQSTQAQR